MDDSKAHYREVQVIYDLRANILPHRQWALSKWFSASELWYYHREGKDEEIVAKRNFHAHVDPDLRELCHILHELGMRTTPSCQGHFHDREHFEKTWAELNREAEQIVRKGLRVVDSETQQEFLFRNIGYALPWKNFDDFHKQAAAHQSTGFLGIVIPHEHERIWMAMQSLRSRDQQKHVGFDPALSKKLDAYVFDIFVHAKNPQDRSTKWRSITDMIVKRLTR